MQSGIQSAQRYIIAEVLELKNKDISAVDFCDFITVHIDNGLKSERLALEDFAKQLMEAFAP